MKQAKTKTKTKAKRQPQRQTNVPAKAPVPDDPVFAAIEAHRTAKASVDAIYKEGKAWKGLKPYQMGHQPMADAKGREIATMMALLNTMPRTWRGLACVLEYLGRQPDPRWDDFPDMLSIAHRYGNADLAAVSVGYIARLAAAVFGMIASKAENHDS